MFAYLVGGTAMIILVLILTNVPRDTAVQPTHIALTRQAHTDAIATAVSTNLETDVMVCAIL